jgi:hypothetical protein
VRLYSQWDHLISDAVRGCRCRDAAIGNDQCPPCSELGEIEADFVGCVRAEFQLRCPVGEYRSGQIWGKHLMCRGPSVVQSTQ